MVLTDADIERERKAGWGVFPSPYDITYKSHWGDPWYFVREFYQNGLDEHDEARVTFPPKMYMGPDGLVIEDSGRGIGAESLLLRETKEKLDLRGMFGEGLKWATICALRLGYEPYIVSPKVEIRAVIHDTTFGVTKVQLVTYLWRSNSPREVGTKVVIRGYYGPTFEDRFVSFLSPHNVISARQKTIGRFPREESILSHPSNKLYVRDIYVRDLHPEHPSRFSYNLWNLDLNPDRDAERHHWRLASDIGELWSACDDMNSLVKFLQAVKAKEYESSLAMKSYVTDSNIKDNSGVWMQAWERVFGKNTALYTSPFFAGHAKAYGYEVVEYDIIPEKVAEFIKPGVPTDAQMAKETGVKLGEVTPVPDEQLSSCALNNLEVLRWMCNQITHHVYIPVGAPNVYAARFAPDPNTRLVPIGLWNADERSVFIDEKRLGDFWHALEVFYHEIGHAVSHEAPDGTAEHTQGVLEASVAASKIMRAQPNAPEWRRICR